MKLIHLSADRMKYRLKVCSGPPTEGVKGVDGVDFLPYLCYFLGSVQIWLTNSYLGVDTCATGVKRLNQKYMSVLRTSLAV